MQQSWLHDVMLCIVLFYKKEKLEGSVVDFGLIIAKILYPCIPLSTFPVYAVEIVFSSYISSNFFINDNRRVDILVPNVTWATPPYAFMEYCLVS
jgi:hypothetical protein